MPEWLKPAVHTPEAPAEFWTSLQTALIRIGVAFLFGCIAAAIHHMTSARRFRPADEEGRGPVLAGTLVLLAVLIALVMLVIGESVARAFGLAGALAIVRFRTVVEDTRDTAFVMYAVIAGMAAGTGFIMAAAVCTPVVILAAFLFRSRRPTAALRPGTLLLRLTAGRPPDERVGAAITEHLGPHELTGLSTARGGSALDATYNVRMPAAERVFAVVAELSRLDGVQGVEVKER